MLDERDFRTMVGHYASGLTVISALVEGSPVGFTCQSFHSVSLTPPLVSFSVMRTSTRWPILRSQKKFSINILSERQQAVSDALARRETDQWSQIGWGLTPANNPEIDHRLIWLDCELFVEHEAGDHTIAIARVVGMSSLDDASLSLNPLVFFKGRYHSISPR